MEEKDKVHKNKCIAIIVIVLILLIGVSGCMSIFSYFNGKGKAEQVKVDAVPTPQSDYGVEMEEIQDSAVKKEIAYNISVAKPSDGGEIAVEKKLAQPGETVAVAVTVKEDFELEAVEVNNAAIVGTVFKMPNNHVKVSAKFRFRSAPMEETPQYSIVGTPCLNGSFQLSRTIAESGEIIIVSTTADKGYVLDKIFINGNELAPYETSFKMPERAAKVEVIFKKLIWTITGETMENGSVVLDKASASIGDVITVVATPDVGYALDTITAINATVSGNSVTADGIGDVAITVTFKKLVWAVTGEPTTDGSFTIDQTFASIGDVITVVSTPDVGYALDTITATNATVSGNAVTADGTGDVAITVTFKKLVWTVTREPAANGSVVFDKASASIGDIITVAATPDVGYTLDTITATNGTVSGNSVTADGTGDVAITVTFKKLVWAVAKEPTVNGSFTIDQTSVSVGDVITVAAAPNIGYTLDTITATNGTVSGNSVTADGTGDVAITVTFKKLVWAVTGEPTTDGSFTIDQTSVSIGDVITVTATPNIGYALDIITAINGTVSGNAVTADGTGDVAITVTFKKLVWTVAKEPTVNGSFTIDQTSASVGDVITVTATSDIGYTLDTITATNATVSGNSVTADGTGDIAITVTFKKLVWAVAKEPTVNGSFTIDQTSVSVGDVITVTATSDIGYALDIITATNATVSGNSVTADGTGDVAITVTFKKLVWAVMGEPAANGSVVFDKASASIGDIITVTVTPNIGYALDIITATNATVSGNTIIADGTGDIAITVTFKKLVWAVTKKPTVNGSFTVSKTAVSVGDKITVAATANSYYTLDKITATNATVSGNTVTADGGGDVAISVKFKAQDGYCAIMYNSNKYATISGPVMVPQNTVITVDYIEHDAPNTYLRCLRDANSNEYTTSFNVGTKKSITLNPVICKTELVRLFSPKGNDVGGWTVVRDANCGRVSAEKLYVRSISDNGSFGSNIVANKRIDITKMVYMEQELDNCVSTYFAPYANTGDASHSFELKASIIKNNNDGVHFRLLYKVTKTAQNATNAVAVVATCNSSGQWRSLTTWNIWNKTDIEVKDTLSLNNNAIEKLPTQNGKFSVKSTAIAEEKVTITAEANKGYSLEYIKVNGEVIVGNTFIMPNKKVEIEVMFKKTEK